jgi:hypothetical protein
VRTTEAMGLGCYLSWSFNNVLGDELYPLPKEHLVTKFDMCLKVFFLPSNGCSLCRKLVTRAKCAKKRIETMQIANTKTFPLLYI